MPLIDSARLDPQRSEIWLVDLEPSRGSELQKTRPVVVLSANSIRGLSVRVAVPLTGWQEPFTAAPWKVRIEPDTQNNLSKTSAADSLQIRCLFLERFSRRIGRLPRSTVEDIIYAVNYLLEE